MSLIELKTRLKRAAELGEYVTPREVLDALNTLDPTPEEVFHRIEIAVMYVKEQLAPSYQAGRLTAILEGRETYPRSESQMSEG